MDWKDGGECVVLVSGKRVVFERQLHIIGWVNMGEEKVQLYLSQS